MNDRTNVALLQGQPLDPVGGITLLGSGLGQRSWAASPSEENHVLNPMIAPVEKVIDGTTYKMGSNVLFTESRAYAESTSTFESAEEYDHKSTVQANAKGSYGLFSGGFSTTFSKDTSSLTSHYAAVHNWSEQLWSLRVEINEENLDEKFKKALIKLPTLTDNLSNVQEFVDFFKTYGTDVVTKVTLGGNLTYSIMVEKDSTTSKTDVAATVSAGYGTFVANASTSITDEQKKMAKSLSARIKASGGIPKFNFDPNDATNVNAAFQSWRKSLSKAPRVMDVELKPIHDCVPQAGYEAQHNAIQLAREWYMGGSAIIRADWKSSSVSLPDDKPGDPSLQPGTGSAPALHIVVVGKNRKRRVNEFIDAPARDADAAAFAAFWQRAAEKLAAVTDRHEMVLLATERWPRDSRYYPSTKMLEQLIVHGASQRTLDRWDKLVRNMRPCGVAGMTYVLAGRGMESAQTDFVVAGFGTPNEPNIRPTIEVSVRFVADSKTKSVVLIKSWSEETNTRLQTIRNVDGDKLALAASTTKDKQYVEMVKAGHRTTDGDLYLGQYWYFLRLPRHPNIQNSHILINYETGACLQGFDKDETECMLFPYGDDGHFQQDDVLWDVRGTPEQTHFELVHWNAHHKDLTQIGSKAAVRPWMQAFMLWSLKRFEKFHW